MFNDWIAVSFTELCMIFVSVTCVYIAILLYTRMAGLRSFSKMSAADFAMTVAVGSLFGATISSPSPTLLMGLFSIACLFAAQWLMARLKMRFKAVEQVIDNDPMLLMAGSQILYDNLKRANMTEADLFGKLRAQNILNVQQVRAVVLETTGDVSVVHGNWETPLEQRIFEGVVGSERL